MVNPLRPTKYTGMNQIYANFVIRNRRPTTADYRQPENAKLYRISTVWQVGKNPTTGAEGELWMLSKIVANVATWVLISGGNVGTVVSVTGDDGVVTVPDGGGNIDLVGNVVDNGTHAKPLYVQTGGANTEQWDIQLAAAVAATPLDANDAGISSFNNAQFTVDPTSGMVSLVDPVDNDYHVARYIVSAGGAADGANYTTIASAYAAAVIAGAPQTVFIQPGTYTENITLTAGINLTAFDCDPFNPTVTILGKISGSYNGSASISGINLQTNGDFAIEITGANPTILTLFNCFANATNNSWLRCTSSGGAEVNVDRCKGNLGIAGINYFTFTNSGVLATKSCSFVNSGGSTTANTFANSSAFTLRQTFIGNPITTSGTSSTAIFQTNVTSTATSLTIGGTGTNRVSLSQIGGPAAVAAITVGAGAALTLTLCTIEGFTANVITGAGTLNRGSLVFLGTGSNITTATQNALVTI